MFSPNDRLSNVRDLDGFSVYRGWSETLAAELVAHSSDPVILAATPRDFNERFSSLATANAWHKEKQPIVYSLAKAAELAGFIWYRQGEHTGTDADYTFAIRMYESARGKRLAEPFARATEHDFRQQFEPKGIWLETDPNNSAARNLYRNLGYTVVGAANATITMAR